MNRYVVGIIMLFAFHASSNTMSSRIMRAAGRIAAAGVLAAGSGLAAQSPNSAKPIGDIKPGNYRRPQKLKFTVNPTEDPDPRYPEGYLSLPLKEELNKNDRGFSIVEGEMIESNEYRSLWKDITIALMRPDANIQMTVGYDPLTADSRCAFLFYPGDTYNETFHVCTPADKGQKLRVEAFYSDGQLHEMTPKSWLTVKREQAYEQEGHLQRWFGWMKFWGKKQ